MTNMNRRILTLFALVLTALPAGGRTNELEEVSSIRYRASGIFHVFDATFRASPGAAALDPLGEFPKELEFEYARKIRSEQLASAAEKILEKNVPRDMLENVQSRIDALNAAYRDVGRGDRYSLRYQPGQGTTLSLNGEVIHQIPGDDFQRIYFSIWLGPESPFGLRPAKSS